MKKRVSKFPPYAQARVQALELQLNSRHAYIEWHTTNNIQYLPRYPERAYKDFVSWNDWLGTANVFKGKAITPARDFWEAVKWAQAYAAANDINTMAEWLAHVKTADDIPADIPLRPDTRYDDFKGQGWKTWLGTDIRGRLAAARASTGLLCICSHHSLAKPGNVYAVIQADSGEAELRGILNKSTDLRPVRAWRIQPDDREAVMAVIGTWGRRDDDGWFIANVNNVLFELDQLLTPFVG